MHLNKSALSQEEEFKCRSEAGKDPQRSKEGSSQYVGHVMLLDVQIMARHTSQGEILAAGIQRHYCHSLALHGGGKGGSKVMVSDGSRAGALRRFGDSSCWEERLSQLIYDPTIVYFLAKG